MSNWIQVSLEAGITTLTLNRPEIRNALSDQSSIAELVRVLEEADAESNSRVIILTGAGAAFCAGGDLRALAPESGGPVSNRSTQTRTNYRVGIQRIPLAFDRLEKPVIAAINGPAVGAGFDLACMCDIRVASESAVFSSSFVTLGLVPGDGGAWFLPGIVGWSKAAELILTGRHISAREALNMGLVSSLVADGESLAAANTLASEIVANPYDAVRMSKALLREARRGTLASVLELSATFQAHAHQTEEHRNLLADALKARKRAQSPSAN